eukprot:1177218-Prorocentrum_minimum.AAC.2
MQVLLTYKGQNLAVMDITSKFVPNKAKEAKLCYGRPFVTRPGSTMRFRRRSYRSVSPRVSVRRLEVP